MLRNRHFISYFSTAVLYLSVAGLFFYLQQHTLVSAQKSEEKILNMTLSAFVPDMLPPVEEIAEPEEPIVEEEPKLMEEPVVKPKIIKELEIEEKIVPKPIVKRVEKKPEKKKQQKIKKKQRKKVKTSKKKTKKKQASKKVSARKSQRSKAQKNKFLAKIRAKINKNKTYPRIAKKRRMQGSVKVRFTILRSGKVGNISLSGPKVFYSSAKKAVKKAFPVRTKNASITLPMQINITLRYQIR